MLWAAVARTVRPAHGRAVPVVDAETKTKAAAKAKADTKVAPPWRSR